MQSGKTALHLAAADPARIEDVKMLVEGDTIFSRDNDGNTALHEAAAFNNLEAVRVLVGFMGYTRASTLLNYKGETPLDKAHWFKNWDITGYLRKHGGEYHIYTDQKLTQEERDEALYHCCGEPEMARRLLQNGANPNSKWYPLHKVAMDEWVSTCEVLQILLEGGAKINAVCDGRTPYDCALLLNHNYHYNGEAKDHFLRERGGKSKSEL